MNLFYKMTPEDAETVGYFTYGDWDAFNPFCSEQMDGTYLALCSLVEELKDNENIMKVDWASMTIIDESQIDTKPTPISIENY